MTKLLMMIDRRTRYLEKAFPKSDAALLDEAIERELSRYSEDDREQIVGTILADMQTEFPQYIFPGAGPMLRQHGIKQYERGDSQLKDLLGKHEAGFAARFGLKAQAGEKLSETTTQDRTVSEADRGGDG